MGLKTHKIYIVVIYFIVMSLLQFGYSFQKKG
jgi:hypothetical protein